MAAEGSCCLHPLPADCKDWWKMVTLLIRHAVKAVKETNGAEKRCHRQEEKQVSLFVSLVCHTCITVSSNSESYLIWYSQGKILSLFIPKQTKPHFLQHSRVFFTFFKPFEICCQRGDLFLGWCFSHVQPAEKLIKIHVAFMLPRSTLLQVF